MQGRRCRSREDERTFGRLYPEPQILIDRSMTAPARKWIGQERQNRNSAVGRFRSRITAKHHVGPRLCKGSHDPGRIADADTAVRQDARPLPPRFELLCGRTIGHEVGEREWRLIPRTGRVKVDDEGRTSCDGEPEWSKHAEQMVGFGPKSDDGHGTSWCRREVPSTYQPDSAE
jgi:hypothetical protein